MGQEERAPPPLEATTDPRMQSKWTTHSTAKSVTPKKKKNTENRKQKK